MFSKYPIICSHVYCYSNEALTSPSQRQLQPLLVEVIDSDQTAFLPLRFILDNILLTHKTIQWAKESRPEAIFFELDFNKAYDKVDWPFIFQVMRNLGMPSAYIKMIGMLFQDTIISVNLNNKVTQPFGLHRGIRQGCPLAPHLFIIMAKALNEVIKHTMGTGNLKGINLPQGVSQ
jgi:hypothetical protein